MKRFPLPRPSRPMKKTGRIKPRKRSASEYARIYGSKERVEWVKSSPSVASGLRPCVNAHTVNGGTGRKADACWIVPLTDAEHRELHRIGKESFNAQYGVDLDTCAMRTEKLWQSHTQRSEDDAA